MHFDRQILYLACLFGIQSVSGLAIPEQSPPLEKLASVSRTAHDATKVQESQTAILNPAVPTSSRFGSIFPSADPRIIDSASRATLNLPRFSYDTAPNLISIFHSSDLSSTWSAVETLVTSSAAFPTLTLDDWAYIGHQHELRQVTGASASSASMSSASASGAVASGVVSPGSACSASSFVLFCSSDGTQFGFCVDGHMVWRPVAPGTMCSNGEIQFGISSSSLVSASTTASGSVVSAATTSLSSQSTISSSQTGSTSQASSPTSGSSSTLTSTSSPSQSQSGTTVVGGGTKSTTETKTGDTTSQTTRTTGTASTTTGKQSSNTGTQNSNTGTSTVITGSQTSTTGTDKSNTGSQTSPTGTKTSPSGTHISPSSIETSLTGTHTTPTGMMTPPAHPSHTTGPFNSHHSSPTISPHSHTTSLMSTTGLSPTDAAGNATRPGSDPSHPLTNASVAGIASGLAAGAVMVALGGLYAWRRKKQGKPLFGARGSKRSTGSFYPKSAWLYDPPVSPNHSRAGSEAGQNLIPAPRPETSEMEAGMASPDLRPMGAASPDLRAGRASSPLLPPPITITRDESPDGSPGESPRRSGGRRSRPMMSINEEDE